ncbi:hypothetical protein MVEN_00842700 [Mycena venus]|uniref:F-box domain-containing protein n=1 Tax=Mycena venus TaxID=2733690 RepID=A0A8H6YBG0_9AGAR|nr:hypothetical protein MVEN_00842700 [Mycena venus]
MRCRHIPEHLSSAFIANSLQPTSSIQKMNESLYTHLFNTNCVPSHEEIEDIRVDLLSRSQELARIDERIRKLVVEHDKIQKYIDAYRALISHPRRLPPDIVREIFIAYLPTTVHAVMSAQEAPLVLCRICSTWRTIALSTPRLWASLHLPLDFILNKTEQRMPAIARWLGLSGACPISLSVLGEDPFRVLFRRNILTDVNVFTKLLAQFSDRWSNIEFFDVSMAAATGFAAVHTPRMESLKITAETSVIRQLDLFRVPSLHTLALHAQGTEGLDDFVLDLPLFWDRLTHLNLDSTGPQSPSQGLSLYNVFVLLGRSPQLISFAFRANTNDHQADSISGLIALPSLESFVLFEPSILEPSSIAHFLEHLFMPALRELHIPTVSARTEPATNFLQVVTVGTTSPMIQTLLFNLGSFIQSALLDALRCFPSLTKLAAFNLITYNEIWEEEFEDVDVLSPDKFLALLTPVGLELLCPRLQEVQVRDCTDLLNGVVIEFIQRRRELTAEFCKLGLLLKGWGKQDMSNLKDEIQPFAPPGFDLCIINDDSWARPPAQATPWTGRPTINWSE